MHVGHVDNRSVIPEVGSVALFSGNESHHLAVGIVAVGKETVPGLEHEHNAYRLLRGNVYAHQKQYMPVAELNSDGTESDADDDRSIHFGLFENTGLSVRAVGAMRLIIKSTERDDLLPIEHHYPEAFHDGPPPIPSAEVSRLICRYEDERVQSALKWPLFAASLSYALERRIEAAFGAVEAGLEQRLRADGVLVTTLAEPKFVPEFNAVKAPLCIDLPGLRRRIRSSSPDLMDAVHTLGHQFVYSGTITVHDR